MKSRILTFVLLLGTWLLGTSPLAAEVELTPMLGYSTGSVQLTTGIVCAADIRQPCPDSAETQDDIAFSLIADFSLSSDWWIEARVSHYESELDTGIEPIDCPACNALPSSAGDLEILSVELGMQRRWGDRIQPFAALTAGVSKISTSHTLTEYSEVDEERPSAGLAAGILLSLGEHLGLRFEGRAHWIDLPSGGPFLDGSWTQEELAGGLTLRW